MSTSKKLNDSSVAALTAVSDSTALVAADTSSGAVRRVTAGALKTYIGAACVAKAEIPAGGKTAFIFPPYEQVSFSLCLSNLEGQASGIYTKYGAGAIRCFMNGRKKSSSTPVKTYATSGNGAFVVENTDPLSRKLYCRFISSAKITAEEYSEAAHGSLEELELLVCGGGKHLIHNWLRVRGERRAA